MTGQNHDDVAKASSETHRNDTESRALARRDLETRMISQTSAVLTDFSWATPAVIRTLITSLPAGDPAISMLAGLLSQHNALAPIHTLPVELFLVVLSYVVDDSNYASLSRVGAVCTSWRRIVISSPSLWIRMNLCKRVDFALTLDFPRHVPISVTFDELSSSCANTLPDVYAAISDRATHIASLEFTLPYRSGLDTTLLGNFPSFLPLLHTLVICSPNYLNVAPGEIAPGESFLLRNTSIANTTMPVLRKLRLIGMSLPFTLPLFRGLVDLCITLGVKKSVLVDLGVFRDLLSACPQLESLALDGVGPFSAESETNVAALPIPLPKLKSFDLHYDTLGGAMCAKLVVESIATNLPTADMLIAFRGLDDSWISVENDWSGFSIHFKDRSGWNPHMHWLLSRFPTISEAEYSPSVRWLPNDFEGLSAMLADPHLQQLECLTTRYVPLGVVATILKNRGTGMLKQLILYYVPMPGTEMDEGDLEFLKGQVGDVDVIFCHEDIML
ncbi:hypothetical protein EVG20_g2881 [Dentipellis fragilis]|uniref:F-box domain-containing protein n=1 Tax=Dentipellis fragilis TaxID=205917 RepID=A0A4Y9Z5H5_9AGAM|nr:hypothetical protein EVG20_g2881 [Dentipellis fragilis]